MGPEQIRNDWGFAGLGASFVALISASPALAQGINANTVVGAAPLAVALGVGSSLVSKDILQRADWPRLTASARAFVEAIRRARA